MAHLTNPLVFPINTSDRTGWYWIDPNLGMPDDAIYVFCNMTGLGETCVFPESQTSKMPNIPWRKESGKEDWYSNMRGASKVKTLRTICFSLSTPTPTSQFQLSSNKLI